jgi:hypothetical protein
MAGHDHTYERLDVGGLPYFVNGVGGQSLYNFSNVGTLPAGVTSIVRYNDRFGAMLVTATESGMTTQFFNTDGVLIDEYTLSRRCIVEPTVTIAPTTTSVPSQTPTSVPTATPLSLPTPSVQSTPTAEVSVAGIAQASTAVAIPQLSSSDERIDLIGRVTSWLSKMWNDLTGFWK